MKQKIEDTGFGAMIELEIDNREVFSEEFKHYAKMVYLGSVAKIGKPNAMDISEDGIHIGGGDVDQNKLIAEIASKLCKVSARAVAATIAQITEELVDPDRLNAGLKELFGDFWDEENRRFNGGL